MDLEHSLGVWLPARTKHHCISDVFTFLHYVLDMLLHPQVSKSTPGPSHKQFFSPALPLTNSTHPLSPSLCILPWESIPFCFLWSESLSHLLQFKCWNLISSVTVLNYGCFRRRLGHEDRPSMSRISAFIKGQQQQQKGVSLFLFATTGAQSKKTALTNQTFIRQWPPGLWTFQLLKL